MSNTDNDWIVYILRCADNTLYTGITNDIERRVMAHNNGSGAKYTKGRAPVQVIYTEVCSDRSNASKRERQIKMLDRNSKLNLVKEANTNS